MVKKTSEFAVVSVQGAGTGLLTCVIPDLVAPSPLSEYKLGDAQLTLCAQHKDEFDFLQVDAELPIPEHSDLQVCVPTTDTQEVADTLNGYWSQFWTWDDEPTTWDDFSSLLHQTPALPEMDVTLTFAEWKQAIQHLKVNTARGICGWYAQELRDLPDQALDDLLRLFSSQLSSMPAHLMTARTIPLGKTKEPDQAHLTRPITILSLLYRLWGRATTTKILQYWSASFLPQVGFLPGRSLANAMIAFQNRLEQAHMGANVSYGGLTLDLIKAFNFIGREPAAEAMMHYGVPSDWVQFWYASITDMHRVWEINGSLSSPFHPTTGCPEGDTWSVVAMLALSIVWVHMLSQRESPVASLCYADNLGWSASDTQAHHVALTATIDWSTSLRLQVDWKKTWVWATDTHHSCAWVHL